MIIFKDFGWKSAPKSQMVRIKLLMTPIPALNLCNVGLFTVTGIGLIPSRVLDTYRVWITVIPLAFAEYRTGIAKIWHYKRKTQKLRAKAGLPQLFDVDDLPDPAYDPNYVHVLTDEEQQDLHRRWFSVVAIALLR